MMRIGFIRERKYAVIIYCMHTYAIIFSLLFLDFVCTHRYDTFMPNREGMNICFSTKEEKREAIEKAKNRGKSVSEIVQTHFRKLPLFPKND